MAKKRTAKTDNSSRFVHGFIIEEVEYVYAEVVPLRTSCQLYIGSMMGNRFQSYLVAPNERSREGAPSEHGLTRKAVEVDLRVDDSKVCDWTDDCTLREGSVNYTNGS